jgi:hypothetical protein
MYVQRTGDNNSVDYAIVRTLSLCFVNFVLSCVCLAGETLDNWVR